MIITGSWQPYLGKNKMAPVLTRPYMTTMGGENMKGEFVDDATFVKRCRHVKRTGSNLLTSSTIVTMICTQSLLPLLEERMAMEEVMLQLAIHICAVIGFTVAV